MQTPGWTPRRSKHRLATCRSRVSGSRQRLNRQPTHIARRPPSIVLYTQDKQKQDAIRYVDGGDWTTDAVAAATLTTTNAADFPLWYRLYEWLYPTHAYDYRIRRTLRVVETQCAEATTGFAPVTTQQSWIDKLRGRLQTDTGGDS